MTFASKRALVAARPSVVYAGGALGPISGYRPVRVFGKLPTDFPNDFLGSFCLDNRVFVSYTYYRSFTWRDVRVWLKEHDWKSCIRETVSRVRIPLSPYASPCIYCKGFFVVRFSMNKPPAMLVVGILGLWAFHYKS